MTPRCRWCRTALDKIGEPIGRQQLWQCQACKAIAITNVEDESTMVGGTNGDRT